MAVQPFISVIIPTHNRLAKLTQTLACLARQTYPADQFEIIVVDDGSTDGTADYLYQLAGQEKLRYLKQDAYGPATARNAGVQMAQGEIVVFTDDDCLPEPGWLAAWAKYYSYRDNRPAVVAAGGCIKNVADGHWLHRFYHAQNRHSENQTQNPNYLDTANAAFRRAVFLEIGGFNEAMPFAAGEDVDFGFRLTAAGHTLLLNPEAVVWHVGHTSVWRFIKHALIRGRGNAFLFLNYPDFFAGPSSQGMRLSIRRSVDRLYQLTAQTPVLVRPFLCALVVTLRHILFMVPEISYFKHTYLARQRHRYRTLNLTSSKMILYVFLEWSDYLLQLIGRIRGVYTITYHNLYGEKPD